MAITAASVEANGWVLRVTHTAGLGSFASYVLDPNGSPRLVLTSSAPGFAQSGGTAVSASTARTLIATKPLRLPVQATAAGVRSPKTIDETDLGGGVTRVRIALSQHVYATDTGLTLTAIAGWRSGESAASGIAVTNASTVAAPAPIARWADVPYQLQGGAFDLEVVVASHHPSGLAPVAGVKFTVTDGTTVKTVWSTALATSTAYAAGGTGQPLRVHKVTVDPTGLTKGLLRCDFEVCPWLGPLQKSDVAGTKSMTGLGTAAMATSAFVPFVVAYNPAGSWITPRYAYVAAGGAATAAAANVSASAAVAAATPLASINLAIESLRLHAVANPGVGTVVAANGQAAIAQSLDGCRIRLAAGVTLGSGTTAVTSGVATAASWLVIEGDPADASPVADCILRSPTTVNGIGRISRIRLTGMTVEAQANAVVSPGYIWADGIEIRGVAGQEATTGNPFAATGALLFATATKWWRHGTGPTPSGATQTPVLLRGIQTERSLNAPAVLNCARLPTALAGLSGVASSSATAPSSDAGASLERLIVGCDLRYLSGAGAIGLSALANAAAPAGLSLGKTYPVACRQAWLNNTAEVYGTGFPLFSSIGENSAIVATENIIEGNTFTGDRTNSFYNDLNLATIALNDSEDALIRVNRFANNVAMKCASKHDFYNDGIVLGQRSGVALTATRNRAYAVGAEIVVAGSPANVYHCTTAGTTAATGGPTGTASDIADGTVHWSWFATETRQHGFRPQATGAWSSHYGVGYEGNIDLQPPPPEPSSDPEFWFEFFGLGSNQLSADGVTVTSTPFTLDKSGTTNRLSFQPLPDGTGGGNYKPLASGTGLYLLGRARSANVDTDARGVARVIPFAAGSLEGAVAATIVPAADRQTSRAASPLLGWTTTLGSARGTVATRATAGGAGWTTRLTTAGGVLATRAATTAAGWSVTIAAQSGRMASPATPGIVGWTAVLVVASAGQPTTAGGTMVAWRGAALPGSGRLPTTATAPIVTTAGPWLIAIGSGCIAVTDRTLPILLPGTLAPPERTLIVTGDFRTTTVD